jgi:polysaccharide chain length determinant protein (PEP-CTERM system associated)
MPNEELERESSLGEILERVRHIVIRRRWWIVLPTCGAILLTMAVLRILSNRYTSQATLLVVQQQVPQRYVTPNSTTDVVSELEAMKQEILARPRLTDIIREFGLYPKATKRQAPEQVLELLTHDIDIQPILGGPQGRDLSGFKIAFTAENPVVAQQVTSRLTSLFIQENLKRGEAQDANTTSFLREQLEAARAKLTAQEQHVRDFKMQFLGELPEQQSGNLAILAGLQTQLQTTMGTLSRAQQQRVYLQSLLSGYEAMSARNTPLPGSNDVTRIIDPVAAAEADLAHVKLDRDRMLIVFGSKHPEALKAEGQVAAAEAALKRLKGAAPATQKAASPVTQPDKPTDQPAVAQIKSQLEANRVELDQLAKDETRLRADLERYQNRLNLTPVREQQLTGILRDYDLQKKEYEDLLSKEQQSQLATNLGRDQRGQQFRLVEPPSLPAIPSSPKRLNINLGGVVGGLVLGLALAFLRDMADRSFHTEKELSQRFSMSLVVGVPLLLTPGEGRKRTWKAAFEWSAGCVLALALCAAEYYSYRHPK